MERRNPSVDFTGLTMKTITRKENHISPYIFDDSAELTLSATQITTPDFIIGDMGSDNADVHENVTPPDNWQGNRYTFDGTTWAEVTDWVDPKIAEIARLEEEIAELRGV